MPKIRTAELGYAMVKEAEKVLAMQNLPEHTLNVYENKRIKTEVLNPADFTKIAERVILKYFMSLLGLFILGGGGS